MSSQGPQFLLYQAKGDQPQVLVRVEDETVWLSQAQMADIFQTTKQNVSQHVQNVFDEGELAEKATVKDFLTVQTEGGREVQRNITRYNLDVIISVGYRVKSHVGTQFRIWATKRIRELIVKGFVLDDQRLKSQTTVADYFDELLERVRDIRSSEKLLYKRVRDICALSIDYDGASRTSREFFATVQNKFLYAVAGGTAAEIVNTRADAKEPNMGLTSFDGEVVRKKDVKVAKNYLSSNEIDALNLLVSQFLDFSELQAKRQREVRMAEWVIKLDEILHLNSFKVLTTKGKISQLVSEQHAHEEYKAFEVRRKEEKDRELDAEPDVVAELESETKSLTSKRKSKEEKS